MSAASETGVENEGMDHTSEELEHEARSQGWVPKDEFKGDPGKWVDAEEFVEKARHVMPLLRKNNERLERKLAEQGTQLANVLKELDSWREDFKNMEEFHKEDVKRQVEDARKALKAELKAARAEDDVDREIEAQRRLNQLDSAEAAAKTAEDDPPARKKQPDREETAPTPDLKAWMDENKWYGVDEDRSREALRVADDMAYEMRKGRLEELKGAPFFAELDRRLSKLHGSASPRGQNKVGDSKTNGAGRNGKGKGYNDLSAEAKEICDRQAERFVRKDGTGRFKTVEDFRSYYVKTLEESSDYFH